MGIVAALRWVQLGDLAAQESPPVPPAPAAVQASAGDAPHSSAARQSIDDTQNTHLQVWLSNLPERAVAAGATLVYEQEGPREQHFLLRANASGAIDFQGNAPPRECLVWHRHGARKRLRAMENGRLPSETTLDPAGAITVRVPALRRTFVARCTPAGEVGSSSDRYASIDRPGVEATGRDHVATCEGVPASWGTALVRVFIDANPFGRALVPVKAGEDIVVVIDPISSSEVRGTVVDHHGSPIADAAVYLTPADEVRVAERSRLTYTDVMGSFVLPSVLPMEFQLQVSKPGAGYLPFRRAIDCGTGSDIDLGRLSLTPGRVIKGVISHASIPNNRDIVRMFPGIIVGCMSVDGPNDILNRSDRVTSYRNTTVGEDGHFELRGLDLKSHLVFVAEEGMGGPWSGVLIPSGSMDVDGLVLTIPSRRTYRATVPSTTPRITEVLATSTASSWFARAPMSPNGHAEVAVGDGPFLVGIRSDYHVRWIWRSSGLVGSETLAIPGGSLRIEGLDGKAVGNPSFSWIELTYLDGQLDAEHLPLTVPAGTITPDATGAITLPYLLPGRYRVTFRAQNWGRRERTFDLLPGEAAVRHWLLDSR